MSLPEIGLFPSSPPECKRREGRDLSSVRRHCMQCLGTREALGECLLQERLADAHLIPGQHTDALTDTDRKFMKLSCPSKVWCLQITQQRNGF